jgi:hypothetical protein
MKVSPSQPPTNSTTKSALCVTVNGTQCEVTPDPPPAPGKPWWTVNATLPPLFIDARGPDSPATAVFVLGEIHAESGGAIDQGPDPTISAVNLGANDAVSGTSTSGVGVAGSSSTGNGVRGTASGGDSGVFGNNTGTGAGVTGSSTNGNGVEGRTGGSNNSGVSGDNTGAGVGVAASSTNGIGISAKGTPAGSFDGNVLVNGTLMVTSMNVGQAISDLQNRVAALEQQVAQLTIHRHGFGGGPRIVFDRSGLLELQQVKDWMNGGPDTNQFAHSLVELRSDTSKTVNGTPEQTGPPEPPEPPAD